MAIFKKKHTQDLPRRRQADTREPAKPDTSSYVFQRNRTLTGSTSERISTTQNATDLRSPRTHVHHLALKRRKVGFVFLVVLASSALLTGLLMEFTASVKVGVSDSGYARELEPSSYEQAINDYLTRNPLSRLRFMLDKSELTTYLSSGVAPEVAAVSAVSLQQIGVANVTLTMRQPVAGWTIDSRQYFVDADGVAFEKNYYSAPSVQIVDNSGISLQQGVAVASNRFLSFVGRVVSLSKERGYTVVQAVIPSDTTRQLEVQLDGITPRIRFSIDRPAGEQVEDMTRSLQYLASRGVSPSYVDVRVSGKAFYK